MPVPSFLVTPVARLLVEFFAGDTSSLSMLFVSSISVDIELIEINWCDCDCDCDCDFDVPLLPLFRLGFLFLLKLFCFALLLLVEGVDADVRAAGAAGACAEVDGVDGIANAVRTILAFWNSSFFKRKYASSNVSLLSFVIMASA